MARRPILLVGNGPNRVEARTGNPSWDKLMRNLAAKTGQKGFNTGSKPLPLAFEEVLGRAARTSGMGENDLKHRVAEVAGNVAPNRLHRDILALPVSDILTTNYDYALSPSLEPSAAVSGSTETKYSLFRRQVSEEKTIWHIHGEAAAPDTILLGHDHYIRYSGRIQEYLRPSSSGVASPGSWKVSDATSPLGTGVSGFEDLEPTPRGYPRYSWVDLFLTREVHIIGLGMDFSEIIIWWLLTIRSRREEREKHGLEPDMQPEGPVVWWECGPKESAPEYVDRREVAQALGVDTRFYRVSGKDYAGAYSRVVADLSARLSA